MKRRNFITLLGGAATWPVVARAQQPAVPVIGYINTGSLAIATEGGQSLRAFQQGLAEAGYAEGRNVAIEYRWADEIYDRLPAMFDDLVRRRVSVIVVTGGAMPLVLEKAAGATIPVVFTAGVDPVRAASLQASIARAAISRARVSFPASLDQSGWNFSIN
jgi:putative ABC transport system substrate-binding protein